MDTKTLFQFAMDLVPAAVSAGIKSVEAELASNDDKKTKAVAVATTVLGALDKLAGKELSGHPAVQAALAKANDVMVEAARTIQQVHDAAAAEASGGQS
jgi:hypothetical protein